MRLNLKLALFALLAVAASAPTARAQGLRRFAIVAGNDTCSTPAPTRARCTRS